MYNFTYHVPTTIYFGKGQIEHLGEVANSGNKTLLVYGGGSIKKNGIYDTAMGILKDAGVEVFELSGVEPNPRIETVRKGVEICKNEGINSVLAIGGGSSIDCAKVVAAGALYDGDSWDIVLDGRFLQSDYTSIFPREWETRYPVEVKDVASYVEKFWSSTEKNV